jgi:uncharacterized protein
MEIRPMTPNALDEFLAGRRFAFVGVSVIPDDPSRQVWLNLRRRGHDLVPIRPGIGVIDGRRAYSSVTDVPGRLDGAVIMTAAHRMEREIYECAERGVKRVWLDPGDLRGVPEDALDLCARRELVVFLGGELPVETTVQRVRRESRQFLQAFAISARLRVLD